MSADRSRPPPEANSPAEATGLLSPDTWWFALSIAATVLVGTLAVFALVPTALPVVDPGGPPSKLDSATGDLDTPLRIAPADITYMNRIFHERTHEIGYCGVINDG